MACMTSICLSLQDDTTSVKIAFSICFFKDLKKRSFEDESSRGIPKLYWFTDVTVSVTMHINNKTNTYDPNTIRKTVSCCF